MISREYRPPHPDDNDDENFDMDSIDDDDLKYRTSELVRKISAGVTPKWS